MKPNPQPPTTASNPLPPATAARELTPVVLDVLGELAFLVTDDGPVDMAGGTIWMQGDIEYRGPLVGRLQSWCTRGLAIKLAANLLALEPDEGEAQVGADDALREFMNVLCGQLVTRWYGAEAVFNLSIPRVRECMGAPQSPAAEPGQMCQLSIEGEPLICIHELGAAGASPC